MDLLIVDDEPLQRAQLKQYCQRGDALCVVGEVSSGAKAIEACKALGPDLMVLDAELPDMTGFDVMRALRPRGRTVLVTANAKDRSTAFAAGAVDCLLKPVKENAFLASMMRACERLMLSPGGTPKALRAVAPALARDELEHVRPLLLVGEREHRLYPLDPERIDYIESAGNYVKYHIATMDYIARESIKGLEQRLQPLGFVRIERSLLLNIRAIAYAQPIGHGIFAFTLVSGTRLHSGHAFRDTILAALPLRRRAPMRDGHRAHPAIGDSLDDRRTRSH